MTDEQQNENVLYEHRVQPHISTIYVTLVILLHINYMILNHVNILSYFTFIRTLT